MNNFLWSNRERAQIFSHRWFVIWAKRVLRLPDLLRIFARKAKWERRGAKIGTLSILGKIIVNGQANNLTVGEFSFIGSDVKIATHGKVSIGNYVSINDGVRILTASHDTSDVKWLQFSRNTVIDDFCWIATDSIILPGVHIGKGAVVGAGAVVTKDVPDLVVVAGNPARQVGRRPEGLSYNPVIFAAPYEAWIGRSVPMKVSPNES